MLQLDVSSVLDVSELCFKYFICMIKKIDSLLYMLQWLHMHVASVCSKCFKKIQLFHVALFYLERMLQLKVSSVPDFFR
jgi:hypothetical protein